MDGTFSVAPRLFYHLYTLHICFRGFFLPLIYALLPDNTKDTYYDMFSIIKRKMANLDLQFNPTTMMSDLEIGMISTLRLHFPNTELKGCNFHFSQAIWRQTQQLGLTVSYHENSNIHRTPCYSGIHTPCSCVFGPSWRNFGDIELKLCICFKRP